GSLPPTKPRRKAKPSIRDVPQISAAEYAIRRESVAAGMQASGLDALCVFYPARVAYLTGFHHIPTERPIALVIGSSRQSWLSVEDLRCVKAICDLVCIQLSCDGEVRARRRMQAAIQIGKTEMECYAPPATETLFEMVREMPGWRPRGNDEAGLIAMFVAGRSTAMPHGFVKGHGIQPGDVLVSGARANIDGYRSELERTMIIGEPTEEQARALEAMLALQTRAIETMAPGVPAAEVELATLR